MIVGHNWISSTAPAFVIYYDQREVYASVSSIATRTLRGKGLYVVEVRENHWFKAQDAGKINRTE